MLLPAIRIECDVREQVDRGLEHIEGLVRTILVKAVCALAAFNIHAKHLALAVCAAQMRVLCNITVHADEDAVMMLVLVEQLFMCEIRNHLAFNVPLVQEVGVDAAHIAVGLRQGEGLRLRCGRLRLLERSTVLTPQQK